MTKASKKSPEAIAAMRQAGQIVGEILFEIQSITKPSVTPADLDGLARKILQERQAAPAFLGYHGYPATICVSVNDTVVHGIPSSTPFVAGDLISVDAGAVVDGYYADAAISFVLDPATPETTRLLETTEAALAAGIARVRDGVPLGDVQAAIGQVIDEAKFGIVYDLTGHGIGRALHEDPSIPNFGRPGSGPVLQAGMTICLEPMVTAGRPDVRLDRDGWTIRTQDHSLSAHFEHTILVTSDGSEILTNVRPWPH